MPTMSQSNAEWDELVGSGTEEAVYKKAFEEGFHEGTLDGNQQGWVGGLKTGADTGFELGKYKGFAVAARQNLTSTLGSANSGAAPGLESGTARLIKICDKIIKLVDEFDLANVSNLQDACSQVRVQYNLLKTSLGIEDIGAPEQTISGQKYSF